jgi:hypothetical protein
MHNARMFGARTITAFAAMGAVYLLSRKMSNQPFPPPAWMVQSMVIVLLLELIYRSYNPDDTHMSPVFGALMIQVMYVLFQDARVLNTVQKSQLLQGGR